MPQANLQKTINFAAKHTLYYLIDFFAHYYCIYFKVVMQPAQNAEFLNRINFAQLNSFRMNRLTFKEYFLTMNQIDLFS